MFEASGWWWILCEYMPFAPGPRRFFVRFRDAGSAWVLTPLPKGPRQHPSCAHVFVLPFYIFVK